MLIPKAVRILESNGHTKDFINEYAEIISKGWVPHGRCVCHPLHTPTSDEPHAFFVYYAQVFFQVEEVDMTSSPILKM